MRHSRDVYVSRIKSSKSPAESHLVVQRNVRRRAAERGHRLAGRRWLGRGAAARIDFSVGIEARFAFGALGILGTVAVAVGPLLPMHSTTLADNFATDHAVGAALPPHAARPARAKSAIRASRMTG